MRMSHQINPMLFLSMLLGILFWLSSGSSLAQEEKGATLLEYYNTANQETLDSDTERIADNLKDAFNKKEIIRTENDLQFSRYYISFKNLILYANKLAGYTDYEENIKFGRDNELYRQLPVEGKLPKDKKMLISEKYNRLEQITVEEIDTYKEMMEISFNACEFYTENDFNFFGNHRYKEVMENFLQAERYQLFEQEKRALLEKDNGAYVKRIDRLIASWRQVPPTPDSPIIDPEIIRNL